MEDTDGKCLIYPESEQSVEQDPGKNVEWCAVYIKTHLAMPDSQNRFCRRLMYIS